MFPDRRRQLLERRLIIADARIDITRGTRLTLRGRTRIGSNCFSHPRPGSRATNVHVRVQGGPNQRYALLFRDYLRAHLAGRSAYAELKRRLAALEIDSDVYADVNQLDLEQILERLVQQSGHARDTDHTALETKHLQVKGPKSLSVTLLSSRPRRIRSALSSQTGDAETHR